VVDSVDWVSISIGNSVSQYVLTIRSYREAAWGKRYLGSGRYALDMGHISLVLERYAR
jgi:hypothetical protein